MSEPSGLQAWSPMPKASYTDRPPTPKASYTDFWPGSSTPWPSYEKLSSCPPTPKASYTEAFSCPPTPKASDTEPFSYPHTPNIGQGGSPKPLTRSLSADAVSDAPPMDDCNDSDCCGHNNDQLHFDQYRKDENNQRCHEADDDDVLFIACRPKTSNSLGSPIMPKGINKLAERPSPSHRCVQKVTSPTPAKREFESQGAVPLDTEIILQKLKPIVGRLIQGTAQGCSWDSILLELGMPDSSQLHRVTTQDQPRPSEPSTSQQNVSASSRKRKHGSRSNQADKLRSKKRKTYIRETQDASYKPIAIILPTGFVAKSQPKTWRYEWNNKRNLWINEGAPERMREWTGEELCMMLDGLIVEVRPNSGWLPVSMQWREADEDEARIFEGSDILQDWTYQITSEVMLQMLRGGGTGMGVVTKYRRHRA
ncbi:hypothetical protein FLAG1_08919 [Fusarium langsethiae]|uniref:Tpr protein n=2 Tax=Fusarium sambucinum species complex TaxID=569360 RepID=A0A0N0DCH8_FUSLA|nr:hypothetical protein FLAG1_08919 [Fusarium langsethiae]OBS20673.1 hypothetical protein FPOA_07013 [Fusarium poae]GKU07372.1 unnamed protein product [Fusarium langsethiae]